MAPRSSQEEVPEEEGETPGRDEFVADLSKFAEDRGYDNHRWLMNVKERDADV